MKARDEVTQFMQTLTCGLKRQQTKRKALLNFIAYLESSEDLSGEWNFNMAVKLVYGDHILRLPVRAKTVADYLSFINNTVCSSNYNNCIATLNQFFQYMVNKRAMTENPAAGIERNIQ